MFGPDTAATTIIYFVPKSFHENQFGEKSSYEIQLKTVMIFGTAVSPFLPDAPALCKQPRIDHNRFTFLFNLVFELSDIRLDSVCFTVNSSMSFTDKDVLGGQLS